LNGAPADLAHLIPGAEVEFVTCSIRSEVSIRIELIGERACRSNTYFLMRGKLGMHQGAVDLLNLLSCEPSVIGRDFLKSCFLDIYDKLVAVEKIKRWFFGIVKAEDGSEVPGDSSPP
jgi:hypothetical protein